MKSIPSARWRGRSRWPGVERPVCALLLGFVVVLVALVCR